MTSRGRAKLVCKKEIRYGIWDIFTVIVPANMKDEYKKKYESMGYSVS